MARNCFMLLMLFASIVGSFSGPSTLTPGGCTHKIVPNKMLVSITYNFPLSPLSLDECIKECIAGQPKCKSGIWFSDIPACGLYSRSAGNRTDLLQDDSVGRHNVTYFEPCLSSGTAVPTITTPKTR